MAWADAIIADKKKRDKELAQYSNGNNYNSGSSWADSIIDDKQMKDQAIASTINTLNSVGTTVEPTVTPTIDQSTLKDINKAFKKAAKETQPELIGPKINDEATALKTAEEELINATKKVPRGVYTEEDLALERGLEKLSGNNPDKPSSFDNATTYLAKRFGNSALNSAIDQATSLYWDELAGGTNAKNKSTIQNVVEGTLKTIDPLVAGTILNIPEKAQQINRIINDPNKDTLGKIINTGIAALPSNPMQNAGIGAAQNKQALANVTGLDIYDPAKEAKQVLDKVYDVTKYDERQQKIAQETEQMPTWLQHAGNITDTVGYMMPSAIINAVTGGGDIGTVMMGIGAKGRKTKEAVEAGADISTANDVGWLTGGIEAGTEYLSSGNKIFKSKGQTYALDNLINNTINKNIKNPVMNFIFKRAAGDVTEVLEEVISDLAGTAIDRGTINPNAKYTLKDLLQTTLYTIASTEAMNTGYNAINYVGTGKTSYQLNKEEMKQFDSIQKTTDKIYNQQDTSNMNETQKAELRAEIENGVIETVESGIQDIVSGTDDNAYYLGSTEVNPNQELQEVEQQEIKDNIDALNLEEQIEENLEENLEENTNEEINEEQQETTPTTTELELNLENQTQNQTRNNIDVTTGLEDYIKNNNLTELTQENIDDYINQILEEQQANLTEQERKSLIDEYQDIIKDYAKDNGIPVIEAPKIEIPDMTAESKAPSKAIGRETKNEIKNQVNAFNNAVKSEQYKVGNQVKEQYKNLEQKSINKLDNDALFYNVQEQKKNTFTQKQGNYVYQPSSNPRIDAFRRSAATYFKNNGSTQAFARVAEKVIRDKGISIRFDPNLKSNAQITNKDSIVINPNSNRAAEFLLTHELTHAIGNKQMLKMIETYRKSNAEFDEAVKKLIGTYKASEINEEALADISGQLFGNQEFINNLSMEKPSLFKRLYNEIKYMWHQFRGYKNQNEFVEDLYNKWTDAYTKNIVKNDNTKFSMSESQKKYLEKTNNGEKLKEKEFYSLYSAHKIANTEKAPEIIKSIQKNGFKPSTYSYGVNLTPTNHTYIDGKPDINDIYAPKKGDYVLFVPENEVRENPYSIKPGYKPREFEAAQVERDYQPYYELYEKTYDKYMNKSKSIQGLEDYTQDEVKGIAKDYINELLEENGIDDVEIVDMALHGSRLRGTAKANSDLDVVVQYDGDFREDSLFDILNEEPLTIDGIKVDINPIQENIKDYMARSNEYDKEVMSKLANNSDKEYNNGDPELIGLLAAKPEAEKYTKYTMNKEFLNKPIKEMERISEAISRDSVKQRNQGKTQGNYFDANSKSIYSYDIKSDNINYYLKNITHYTEEMESVYERKLGKTNGTNEEVGDNRQSNLLVSDGKNQNNKTISTNDGLLNKTKESNRRNDNKQSNSNIKELENSSFNLDKNAKRYDDLTKTKYIEYFTKDNGDVRINLMDSNNNLVNQFDLYNQREAIKELGEELGKQLYQSSSVDNQRYDIGNDINNTGSETDYFMTHRPTESGITADNLTGNGNEFGLPNDIYEHPEYYSINKTTAQETMDQLNKVRNNPDAEVTIYRATTGDKINKGDWVTLSKSYAAQHNQSQFDGKGNIVEKVVKAKDIQNAGDVLEEWGYFPTEIKNSKDNSTWREYLEKEFPAQGTTTSFNDMLGKETKKTNNTTPEVKKPQNEASNKATEGNKNYLTQKEQQELQDLKDLENTGWVGLTTEEQTRMEELEKKSQGIVKKYPELKANNKYEDIKDIYGKYKNSEISKENDKILKQAKDIVPANKQNRRTIDEWKQVAEYIGSNANIKSSQDLQKLAMETWFEQKPNNPSVLNRQGKKYVKFGVDDWVNSVYKGAGVGTEVKMSVEETTDSKGNKVELLPTSNNTYEQVNTPKPKKTDTIVDMTNKSAKVGDKQVSNFYSNITEKSKFITEENRASLQDNENLKYYDAITNKDTLLDAMGKLDANAEQQIGDFFAKDSFNAEDMATGWILIKRYQDAGNYEAMSNVIETMRDKGTKSGQAIQMLGMLNRLTPEGMEFYAQRQLDNAYNKFVENKSKKEIDKYAQDFTLTPEEHQFIKDTMEKVEKMTNEDDKKVEVAKIVKMLSDKLPPEKGSRIKAWMRISMLGNPKTQVRNVVGNAIIQPFNWLGDTVASRIDKIMSKKTGIRTKGNTDFGALAGGFAKGAKEAVRDAKLGIDTRDINLNRFEENIGAKPFYEGHKSKVLNAGAKVLNKTNQILGNVMSGGDRVFYQAIYDNSLKNQMKLNNVTTPTQEMMQIAEQEALSRTWNDSNEYTKAVLQIRNAMNKLNVKGYGLGDVLVPFAKTPANLTKAIVDYSPVGLVRSILQDGKNYRNSLQNGQYNAQIQHKFADSLGKGFAGTVLWAAAYALAQAGITSGASDDDKDVANFMRNTLGIQPYSIKIGDKSFTYDWAQPIAAPFAAMADFKRLSEKEEKDFGTIVQTAISSASNILLEQSFLSSIQDVFNSYEGPAAAIKQQIEDLPARATPTFFKQIADLIDPVQRQTYVKGNTGETLKNKVQVKIPGASKGLTAQRDTLGREIKKYGGDDNIAQYAFNVFLNPANTNKGKPSAAAEEIYDVYKNTGDRTVMPRQVGYSENVGGTTIPLSAEERNEWQRLSGEKIEDSVKALTSNPKYNSMSYEDKADVINGIVNYSFAKAKSDMFGTQISTQYKTTSKKESEGIPIADYYVDRISKRK